MKTNARLWIGDVVSMKHGIENQAVIGLVGKDRVDVWPADDMDNNQDMNKKVGVPIGWVENVVGNIDHDEMPLQINQDGSRILMV